MRIVYIRRSEVGPFPKRAYKAFRRTLYFNDQDGFFEQSLHSAASVTEYTWESFVRSNIDWNRFDALVVNMKAGVFTSDTERVEQYKKYVFSVPVPTALFIGAAKADFMFSDATLDGFDVIFKREPWKDRTRYNISSHNRDKIIPTMIYCPFAPQLRNNLVSKLFHSVTPTIQACSSAPQYDVGFAGRVAAHNKHRNEVWAAMVASHLSTLGGLQDNPLSAVAAPEALRGQRLAGRAYREAICDAKVNLALEGIGQFTFRHLELWHVGACMLASPSLTELELPLPVQEGEHYHSFSSPADAVAKAQWLVGDESERIRTATAGQACYRKWYDPNQHGISLCKAFTRTSE